ncbi:MAG: CoA transferase [Bacteroidales bacterium]|nr:CoA transferase [Bacteroidales bacterium]
MLTKAEQAQVIFEDLVQRQNIKAIPTEFIADDRREKQFKAQIRKENPFPGPFGVVLVGKRKPAVNLLFEEEKVLQTPAIAAVLAACSSVATEIGQLRGDKVKDAKTSCDIAFAGLQAIRLYMADYSGLRFQLSRLQSAIRVDNAWNGSFYKFPSKDGRQVSFHVYYQDQQRKLVAALPTKKASEKYNMFSIGKDRKEITKICKQQNAVDLEELSFDSGACGCMIRSREEWEATEVGNAVCAMPLIRTEKFGKGHKPKWGKPGKEGPLSGIKVLDLTHIIAGPACSRVLAEYGADVLMVRRGDFLHQEQAMLELDGWAGKNSIQLDFNDPKQLAKCKELIAKADVITYSYQNGTLDKFGLSEEEIRKLNPNIIYSNLMCFSDTVWKQRPGWAPCAEDITGLSVRNGTLENPVNLNGVPLDYFPGMVLALGTLQAIAQRLKEGGGYKVTTSLTRGAQYLHECTDVCEEGKIKPTLSTVATETDEKIWKKVLVKVKGNSTGGSVSFPGPATLNSAYPLRTANMQFKDGRKTWKQ